MAWGTIIITDTLNHDTNVRASNCRWDVLAVKVKNKVEVRQPEFEPCEASYRKKLLEVYYSQRKDSPTTGQGEIWVIPNQSCEGGRKMVRNDLRCAVRERRCEERAEDTMSSQSSFASKCFQRTLCAGTCTIQCTIQ